MGDLLTEHLVVDIGMGVNMDQSHRTMLLMAAARRSRHDRPAAIELMGMHGG